MSSTPMSLSWSASASPPIRVAPTHSRPTNDVVKPATEHGADVNTHDLPLTTHDSRLTTHHLPLTIQHSALSTHYTALSTYYLLLTEDDDEAQLDEDAEVVDHAVDHDDQHRDVLGLRHRLEQVQHLRTHVMGTVSGWG